MAQFQISPLFRETFAAKTQSNPALKGKVEQFLQVKTADPTQLFGASDKPFRSGGIFANAVPKIRHAHLTHDLSMVYTVEGGADPVIRLYGIFSHDDMGTGQPQNLNRQRGVATKFAGQSFSSDNVLGQPVAEPKKSVPTKTPGARPDFTPKAKTAPVPEVSPLVRAVKNTSSLWNQRGLLDKFEQAQTRADQLAVINSELQYLQLIAKRHQLYPNQRQYAEKVIQIYNMLTGNKK